MRSSDTLGIRTGIIVGRFQTPYLHKGHIHLLDSVYKENSVVVVVLGITPGEVKDEKNPYTFNERATMLKERYPNLLFSFIEDRPGDNEGWSRVLDSVVDGFEQPVLYGSRDSFIPSYSGIFPVKELPALEGFSATHIRELMKLNPVEEVLKVSKIAHARHPYEVLTKLVEEVGELAQEVNISQGFLNKPKGNDGVFGEACDIIQCAIDLIYLDNPKITPVEITEKLLEKNAKWKSLL